MKQYHHLQMRFPADNVVPGMTISFQGDKYVLGQQVTQTLGRSNLPIGVLMTGDTRQYLITKDGRPVGNAWFYFYRAFEGKSWAVLDEIEVGHDLSSCA